MDPDAIDLFRELADRTPSEREAYYARENVPAALRAKVESLLRDGDNAIQSQPVTTPAEQPPVDETQPALLSESGEGRFPAGTLLGSRYRIVSRLGRGGMGDVYRATDLKLRQPVALKFLPETASRDPRLLARLHDEVRLARQVSHPNVCRVYDIGDFGAAAYISMEYIDGEDLASLLRRIGRLPHDKALDIARRLCAGLAAAHDKGVIHRDLKPANIMIDGRGQVFITDFGLAATARQLEHIAVGSGTPAYMSPEQLAGREVSTRSDLYALGLVLYEMFTGKRPFDHRRAPGDRPLSISSVAKDLDPSVARAIQRCIELDPSDRPASALAVAASLPGGNPLAEALAAGLTPSPQMVAASHQSEVISLRSALAAFLFVIAGLLLIVALHDRFGLLAMTPFEKPPAVLEQEARKTVVALGYTATPLDHVSGFFYGGNLQQFAERNLPAAEYRAQLARGQPPLVMFWYRQSSQYLVAPFGDPLQVNSHVTAPDEVLIWLDPQGRLYVFQAAPPVEDYSRSADREFDWRVAFTAAGLDLSRFTAAEPHWIPPITFDHRAAWVGTYDHVPSVPMRFEAASWHGRLVYFRPIGPWTQLQGRAIQDRSAFVAGYWLLVALLAVVVAAAAFVAARNHRLGRGDLRGALRLAALSAVCWLLSWGLSEHHVPDVVYLGAVYRAIGSALCIAAIAWVLYMAIEPVVRRRWPHCLVAWTRVLNGRVLEPLVGGHILIGTALGVGYSCWFTLVYSVLLQRLTVYGTVDPSILNGSGSALSAWLRVVVISIGTALGLFVLFSLTRIILRRNWAAAVAFVVLASAPEILLNPHPLAAAIVEVPDAVLSLWILVHLGLLVMVVVTFVSYVLVAFPLSADFSAWYAGATLFAVATVLILAMVSFRIALAGRQLLRDEMLEVGG